MKLYISEPSERHAGPILVCDEAHNDIAEFYHNEHATVGQSYETALALAQKLVTGALAQPAIMSEAERHAIAHARHQVERATPEKPDCCFDFDLVKDLLRVIDRAIAPKMSK